MFDQLRPGAPSNAGTDSRVAVQRALGANTGWTLQVAYPFGDVETVQSALCQSSRMFCAILAP